MIVFGDHTRCVKFVNVPFVQGADGVKVLAPSKQADSRYAYWALKGETIPSKGYARHYALLRKLAFRLPPLREQNRIVEAIESYFTRLDDAVATLERVQRNLRRYRASVLKAAVEGRLVPTEAELARAEGRNYEPFSVPLERFLAPRRGLHAALPTDLPLLPEGWSWATIDQISLGPSSISAGPFGTIFKAKDFRPDGVPIIFLRHVKSDAYRTAKPTFMDKRVWQELFQDYSVYGGELLVTKLGEPPGECCVYPEGRGAAMLTPDVMKLKTDETVVVSRFVMHYLNSTVAKQFALGAAFGTTRSRLTLPLFRAMPVPLPPRPEQLRIVAEVDRLLSIESETSAIAERKVTTTNRLLQSILKWAFEGRLVDQDPTDEPASELLARIQAERASRPRARALRKSRAAPR